MVDKPPLAPIQAPKKLGLNLPTDAKKTAATPVPATPTPLLTPEKLGNAKLGAKLTRNAQVSSIRKGPSPIQKQHRDLRAQEPAEPIQIIFVSGRYDGEQLDLGLATEELGMKQSATWSAQKGDRIRPGANFTAISSRTFSLTLTYFDTQNDISHLGEQIAHLQEVTGGNLTPPYVMIIAGDVVAVPCYCTSIDWKSKEPYSGKKRGYKHLEVQLEFEMAGGQSSEHALGKPLTSTPLEDARSRRTDRQQQKKAEAAKIDNLLADCLHNKDSQQKLQDLVAKDKQSNIEAVLSLPPDALIQAAIGGMFPKGVLSDSFVSAKLRQALSTEMARNEAGVGSGLHTRAFAEVLTGSRSPSSLPPGLFEQAVSAKADFEIINAAIQAQSFEDSVAGGGLLGAAKNLFGGGPKGSTASKLNAPGSTARARLINFGACGLSLRASKAQNIAQTGEDAKSEGATLTALNKLISTAGDKKLQEMFGITSPAQLKALRNGAPYNSRDDFVNHGASANSAVSGYAMWSTFVENNKPKEDKPK